MSQSVDRSRFEAQLAGVHRSAYYAAQQADKLGYQGALRKLQAIQAVAKQLTEDSLSGSPKARARLQHGDDVPF